MTERRALTVLAVLAAISILAFLAVGIRGDLLFAMELRTVRLLALLQVAVSIAMATVVFQTVTANHILTPSIMGMDALYVLLQTGMVFLLDAVGMAAFDPVSKFSMEVGLMALLSLALFMPMIRMRSDLTLLLLVGVVLGILFRSLNALLTRMIDPNDFAVVQAMSFADFNTVNEVLVLPSAILTAAAAIFLWRRRHVLDIMALGHDQAVGLGVSWRGEAALLLALTGILVAISTALVGPVTFLGLMVVALAEHLSGTRRHRTLLAASALVAIIVLVAGQTVLQHGFGNAVTLGVVIEFAGGIAFLVLLFRRTRG